MSSSPPKAVPGAGPPGTAWWRPALVAAFLLLLSLLLLPLVLLYLLYVAVLYVSIWCWWLPRGRDVLFVYSASPIWQAHIETDILPRMRERTIVLNWSERTRWNWGLAPMAFNHFGGSREYNPLAVVFRPFRSARVFRFWQPFRDAKHGNAAPLERLERELFAALGLGRQATPPQQP